jgi:phenylacetate-CoA ligase
LNPRLARQLVYRPATWLRGEPVFRLLRRYERSQWWSPEALRAEQERALDGLVRYALQQSPHYHRIASEAGIDPASAGARDLERLPVLTKEDIVAHATEMMPFRLPGTTSWKTTGGSTGVAVRLRKNRFATAAEQAASWRCYRWYGIEPGDRQARFWGVAFSRRARWRFRAIDFVLNRDRFSAFAFRREHLRGYFDRIRKSRPHWAYGYVSMLAQFAGFCLEEGLPLADLGVRAVVTTSEVLTAPDRALISEAFGAPVFDEYGCGEVGAILYECPDGRLHLMAENLYVELVPDPTPAEPEATRLVVTDLHNRAMPLLRYDLRDRVIAAPPCPCGRGLPAFRAVFGRAYDFVEAPDGTRFHGEFFLYLLEKARDQGLPVSQAQFVQTEPGRIEIRLVPAPGYARAIGERLCRELEERSQGRLHAETSTVDSIEREASGKLRLIRSLGASGR